MMVGLLALALLGASPQARDSAGSHQVGLKALDQRLALNFDSADVLLRAARNADLTSFPAHREYIAQMLDHSPGGIRQLRREYDSLPPSALHACLQLYLSVPHYNISAVVPGLMQMAADGRGGECPGALLAEAMANMVPRDVWAARRLALLEGALHGDQDAIWKWSDYASALASGSHCDRAIVTMDEALGRFTHPVRVTQLQIRKASILLGCGDTTAGRSLVRAVRTAVARDGRPGLHLLFLSMLDEVTGSANGEENALDPVLRDGAALAAQHGAWYYEWRFRYTLAVRVSGRGWGAEALPDFDRAIRIADSAGVPRLQVMTYTRRGRALERLGRQGEARQDLLRAVALARPSDQAYWLAEAYHNLAHAYESEGRLADASWAADRFIETIRPLRYSPLRMTAFLDAGEIRWKAGRHAAARVALDSMVSVVDFRQEYRYYAGEYRERSGELGAAKRYYAAGATDGEELARNLSGLVRVYLMLGELDSAAAIARLHDREPLGERDLPLLPAVLSAQGELEAAVGIASQWAEQRLRQGNPHGAAVADLQLADLLLQRGLAEEALPILHLADSLAGARNLPREQVEARRLRGLALASAGRTEEGLAALREAARLSDEHPMPATVIATHVSLGDALLGAGRPLDALRAFDVAARQSQALTGTLDGDFDRVRYRDHNLAPFDGAIRAILRLPEADSATRLLVEWSQRRKAAALAWGSQRTNGGGGGMGPLSLADLESRLESREALIDYLISDSTLTALVITRGTASRLRLPLTADSLAAIVRLLTGPLLVTFNGRVDLARAPFRLDLAQALYDGLIAPLHGPLAGIRRLVIVPDGVLHYVPFAALVSSSTPRGAKPPYGEARYLLDQYESVYLSSAALLPPQSMQDGRLSLVSSRVLALTYEAPGGGKEVDAIAAAWPGGMVDRHDGRDATEARIRVGAGSYGVLHFAVHAIADDQDPMASYLRLAPGEGDDGLLQLSEIAGQLHAGQLVVLSACEAQRGRLYHGEGLMGLSRAFLATGADAVVASQWPVGASTADLMGSFYRGIAAGRDPGAALREAQLDVRNNPRTAHPFFWAAFGVYRGS